MALGQLNVLFRALQQRTFLSENIPSGSKKKKAGNVNHLHVLHVCKVSRIEVKYFYSVLVLTFMYIHIDFHCCISSSDSQLVH